MDAKKSGEQSNSSAFSFSGIENKKDFFAHHIEQLNRHFAAENFFRVIDNYVVGNLYVRMGIRWIEGSIDFDLVFYSSIIGPDDATVAHTSGDLHNGSPEIDARQNCVFLDVSEAIHTKEGVVSSLVWLEPFKDRDDLGGEIFFKAFDSFRPSRLVIREGKACEVPGLSPMPNGNRVSHMVERGAEIVYSIEKDAGEIVRKTLIKTKFLDVLAGIRILIDKMGVWLVNTESFDTGFQICDMVICTTQDYSCAMERTSHVQAVR